MMGRRFFRRPIGYRHGIRRVWPLLLSGLLCLGLICFSGSLGSIIDVSATAQTPPTQLSSTVVSWDDLRPPSATDFVDPYADLTSRQLIDLAELSRIEFGSDDVKLDSDAEERQRLRQTLQEQGLDVDWLLSQVEGVTAHYSQQATDTNTTVNGQVIKLLGYVLPLTQTKDQVSDFLLVPFIGACIHVPPPPPNQIIYVQPPEAIDNPGLFAQVWLEGTLSPQSSRHAFFRVDGERQVDVSYSIDMISITPYQSSAPAGGLSFDGIAPGHLASGQSSSEFANNPEAISSEYYNNYPLWQRLQVKTSAVFTQTMVRMKTQETWYALPLGLLIAFGYGVLHTLGPGHGKAVIVSYFIGKKGSWQRGVMMGVRIAIFHVISAIAIVILAHVILEQTIGNSASSYRIVRVLSYAAIAIIGGWMLRKSMRPRTHEQTGLESMQASARMSPRMSRSAQETQQRSVGASLLYPTLTEQVLTVQDRSTNEPSPDPSTRTTSTAKVRVCSCLTCVDPGNSGHWLSVAVGAVPCSGALLVLLYGLGNELLWPSMLMVLSISLGMAITLSLIGVIAIWSQNRTQQRIRFNVRGQQWWSRWGPVIGASAVFFIGLFMFGFTLASAIANPYS